MLRLKTRVKEVKNIRKIQEETVRTNADDYMVGLYNGLEMAVAILESREPIFKSVVREPEVIELEEQKGRTIVSGIIRKGSV